MSFYVSSSFPLCLVSDLHISFSSFKFRTKGTVFLLLGTIEGLSSDVDLAEVNGQGNTPLVGNLVLESNVRPF